jgi:hypothetical protein
VETVSNIAVTKGRAAAVINILRIKDLDKVLVMANKEAHQKLMTIRLLMMASQSTLMMMISRSKKEKRRPLPHDFYSRQEL